MTTVMLARLLLAALVAVAAIWVSRRVGDRLGWRPAGPLVVLAATPLVPNLSIALGFSTDDVLPIMGVVLGLATIDVRRWRSSGWPGLVIAGAVLAVVAGVVSSVANATSPVDGLSMALKSVGHLALLGLVGTVAALSMPGDRRQRVVAWTVAVVGTFEAAFGIVAWLLPLPWGAGIEPSRPLTSLYGKVGGRISGTTGLSPDVIGVIFVLSIPLTVALALGATDTRQRRLWWLAVGLQFVALALTYTRTSLVIAAVIAAVLLVMARSFRPLLLAGAVVVVMALVTPLGARLVGDANDRMALWTSAVRMMEDHPLTGVGPGKTGQVAADSPDRYQVTPYGRATSSAHNVVLLAGAETGLIGLVGTALMVAGAGAAALIVVVRGAMRARARGSSNAPPIAVAGALAVLGFLVQAMTNNLLTVEVSSVMATLLLGTFLLPARPLRQGVADILGFDPALRGRGSVHPEGGGQGHA
jgi:O-antigen ligase